MPGKPFTPRAPLGARDSFVGWPPSLAREQRAHAKQPTILAPGDRGERRSPNMAALLHLTHSRGIPISISPKKSLRYNRRMFEPAEAPFRRSMRELAMFGGASTKRRAQRDPEYYERIGRLGGLASAEVRLRQSAALARNWENLLHRVVDRSKSPRVTECRPAISCEHDPLAVSIATARLISAPFPQSA